MDTDFLLELLTYDDPITGRKRTAGLASEEQPPVRFQSCIMLHSFVQSSISLLGFDGQTIEPNWFQQNNMFWRLRMLKRSEDGSTAVSPAALQDLTCKSSVSHDVGVYDDYFNRGEFKSTGEAAPVPKPLSSPLKPSAPAACHGQLDSKMRKKSFVLLICTLNFLVYNQKFWWMCFLIVSFFDRPTIKPIYLSMLFFSGLAKVYACLARTGGKVQCIHLWLDQCERPWAAQSLHSGAAWKKKWVVVEFWNMPKILYRVSVRK